MRIIDYVIQCKLYPKNVLVFFWGGEVGYWINCDLEVTDVFFYSLLESVQ